MYSNILNLIQELLEIEIYETFNKNDLSKWIIKLSNGSLKCPCQLLGYTASNCPFFKDMDITPEYSGCGICPRSEIWHDIQSEIESMSLRYNRTFKELLVSLYIADKLMELY